MSDAEFQFINQTADDITVSQTQSTCIGTTTNIKAGDTELISVCFAADNNSNVTLTFGYKGVTYTLPYSTVSPENVFTYKRLDAEATDSSPLYLSARCPDACTSLSDISRLSFTLTSKGKSEFHLSTNLPLLVAVTIVFLIGFCINAYIFVHIVRWVYSKL